MKSLKIPHEGVIRARHSKDRKNNGKNKKDKQGSTKHHTDHPSY